MPDIDRFLARVVPWPSASLPGYVTIHWPFKSADGKNHMPGRAFQLHPSAVGFTNGMLRNNRPVDLYVNMGLQLTTQPPTMKRGRERRGAIRNDLNTVAHRAFWLDVDIKNGEYPDTTAALTAFGQWRRKVGLPEPSLVVLTGSGGFHVYWVLDTPVAKQVWEPLAYALANAASTEGFKADLKCTIDSVRLMRIPGTFNQKHTPPRLAQIVHDGPDIALAQFDQPLAPYKVSHAQRVTSAPTPLNLGKPSAVFAGVPLPGRLDDGVETYQPTIEEVAAECPFIDATLQTGGAAHAEPLWFESLKVAYYVKDGAEVAHELSDGHPTYSEKDTDNKFDEVVRSHANQRIGWPQCRTIHDAGGQECRWCPHLSKGRSPLNFAVPLVKAAVSIATSAAITIAAPTVAAAASTPQFIPAGFGQYKNGIVYKLVKDPDDPSKPEVPFNILPNPMFDIVAFEKTNGDGKFSVGFKYAATPTRIRNVTLDYEDFHDLRRLGSQLGLQGVSAYPHERKLTQDFMVAFTQQLASAKGRATVLNSAPFGWFLQDGKYQGFVYNRNMYNAQAPVPVQPLSARIAVDYSPTGDMATWKKVLGLITDQRRPELLAPICASIGAPLMRMAGMNGAALHLWGDSGSGKSGSLKVSQTVWGNLRWMAQLQDTANSIDVLSSQLSSFPLIYDEVMKGEDRRLVGMYMRLGQGNSKKRSRRDGQDLGEMHTWFLTLISASNSAMHPHLAEADPSTVAPINRVFDLQVERNQGRVGMLETSSEAERLFGLLNDNYGLAGLELAKFYGTHYDAVSNLLHALTQGVERRTPCNEHDRFYVVMLGIILAGGMIGNKLGLFNIDMDQLEGFMIERLQDLQGQRKTAQSNLNIPDNVERLLAEFVASSRARTLITQNIWVGTGRAPAGWPAGDINSFDLKGNSVDVRVGLNQKIIRVSQPAFHAWLKKERKLTFGDVKRLVLALPNVRLSRWDLGHGLQNTKGARIWALEFTDPSFWEFN